MPDFRNYVQDNLRLPGVDGAREAEIVEELTLDLEERYELALREGVGPGEAWQAIQNQIDWHKVALDLAASLGRKANKPLDRPGRFTPMLHFLNDVRFAARILRKSRGFTVAAIFTLALCLGANLTIFEVIDSILLRPLPFPDAKRLVTTINSYPSSGKPRGAASFPNYYDYREKIKALASTAIITQNSEHAIVGPAGSPYRVERDRISPEFFRTLGVPLLMGRSFTDDEMVYARSSVAILSYPFWRSYFHGDRTVLGRTFQVDGSTTTVVGVLPPDFRFLSRKTQFYIPAASNPEERAIDQRHNNQFQLIARLAPTATLTTARAQLAVLSAEQLTDDPYAAILRTWGFRGVVNGLQEDHVDSIRPVLLLLQGGVLFLLLMGAVNLTNLLLIRANGRAKELAVRQSLGASSSHVVGLVMTEIMLLTLLGGLFGLATAAGGIRLLEALGVDQLPLGSYIEFDGRLALVALAGSLILGIVIATPVAWFSLRGQLAGTMQSESRGGTSSRAAQRLRHSFIVAQIALAFVLLTGAGLLGLSLKRVLETSPGFQTEQVITGQLSLPYKKYPDETDSFALVRRLIQGVRAQPGVLSVAVGDLLPFGGDDDNGVTTIEGVETRSGTQNVHYRNGVAGDYWRTLSIPLIEGRLLTDDDSERKQRLCVVDQAFARRYWPGKSALGHRLNDGPVFHKEAAFTIVGVVASVKQSGLDDGKPLGTVYFPYRYWTTRSFYVAVRSGMPVAAMAPMLREIVLKIDPQLPVEKIEPIQSLIDSSLITRRSPAVLAGIFALVALLLTAVGSYGVLAYAVGQRRREIGLRMALGAQPRQVLSQFLGLGVKLLAAGITLGALGSWATGRAMQGLLFGTGAVHPGVLATTAALMISVVLLATFFPSHKASQVSPTEALRNE